MGRGVLFDLWSIREWRSGGVRGCVIYVEVCVLRERERETAYGGAPPRSCFRCGSRRGGRGGGCCSGALPLFYYFSLGFDVYRYIYIC